jgi:hypothetical protein
MDNMQMQIIETYHGATIIISDEDNTITSYMNIDDQNNSSFFDDDIKTSIH